MNTYIALFRGINVGGHNKLPMKELVAVLKGLGLRDIRTYIQSGNVVFSGKEEDKIKLAAKIGATIRKSHGFEPWVLLLEADALEQAIKANPFSEGEADGKTLHCNFLASVPPKPDLAGLERLKAANERFQLKGEVAYLHAPEGIARSKLASGMERLLGVPMTGRNWNTVSKLQEMIKS